MTVPGARALPPRRGSTTRNGYLSSRPFREAFCRSAAPMPAKPMQCRPWRAAGTVIASLGPPAVTGILHPVLGEILGTVRAGHLPRDHPGGPARHQGAERACLPSAALAGGLAGTAGPGPSCQQLVAIVAQAASQYRRSALLTPLAGGSLPGAGRGGELSSEYASGLLTPGPSCPDTYDMANAARADSLRTAIANAIAENVKAYNVEEEGYSGALDVMRNLFYLAACLHKRMACSGKD